MYKTTELLKRSKNNFITLQRTKQYLRIDHSYDDEMITDMIDIALVVAENYLGLKLRETSWKLIIYDNLPSLIKLSQGPIMRVKSFTLYKPSGEEAELTEQHYMFNKYAEQINMRVQLAMSKAEIVYYTGFSELDLPSPLKQGMLEHITKMYDVRGGDQGLPISVKSLYQPYKKMRL